MYSQIEVPFNWRKARLGRLNNQNIDLEQHEAIIIDTATSSDRPDTVFLTWQSWGDEDVIVLRDWLFEKEIKNVKMYGRFFVKQNRYQVQKSLLGLTFEFSNITDLLHFKLCWQK